MSTEKKKTPLQEAIEQLNKLWLKSPKNLAERNYNSGISEAIVTLKSLLSKEKEFAFHVWDQGVQIGRYEVNVIPQRPGFNQYYKQYEP